MKWLGKLLVGSLGWAFTLLFAGLIVGGIAAMMVFQHYSKDLPEYSQLANYDPPTVTRLYAADGKLLAEYATEKRVFVPLSAMPKQLIDAFLSAEDKNFYDHKGVDFTGVARAIYTNIVNYGQGKSMVGGSTITQQVVKNFLLTDKKSFERKIKEAILAMRISNTYSKDKILELYLNEIFLGMRSYGVAAAALNYFNKSLDELTLEEAALLATMPKAPSSYDPRRNYDEAKKRRDWVIRRMQDDGKVTKDEADQAIATPITLRARDAADIAKADFFAEEVRRWLVAHYGESVLYEKGLVVKTTLDPQLQKVADRSLRAALTEYDRRRGYRGPLAQLGVEGWQKKLQDAVKQPHQLIDDQRLAIVTAVDDRKGITTIGFEDGKSGIIPFPLLKWTQRVIADGVLGPAIKKASDVFKTGDLIIVGPLRDDQRKLVPEAEAKNAWDLQQIPMVNGAMVVMEPHTGRVLAMSGGYAYGTTSFNRATQAMRQPGSSFKPFVYAAALESGFAPNTLILDAPVELSQGDGRPAWKPQNYHDDYLGPTTMRVGLEKSRNTITVRVGQAIGIERVLEIGKRFGVYDNPPRNFSIVLGAVETSLLRMTNAYSMLVNGGKQVQPALIERIDDRNGHTIYRRDVRDCTGCRVDGISTVKDGKPPLPADDREQVMDPRIAYQMVSMLQGVVQRGTATRAASLGRPLAGKTGTTNNSMDTWFMGFTPDLVIGTYIGYDKPQTLGKKETGSSVALPAFINFVKDALKDEPAMPFRIPPGVRLTRVNLHSGEIVDGGAPASKEIIWESFVSGEPVWLPQSAIEAAAKAIPQTQDGDIVYMPGSPTASEVIPIPVPGASEDGAQVDSPSVVGTGGLY